MLLLHFWISLACELSCGVLSLSSKKWFLIEVFMLLIPNVVFQMY